MTGNTVASLIAVALGLGTLAHSGGVWAQDQTQRAALSGAPKSLEVRPLKILGKGVGLTFSDETIASFRERIKANKDVAAVWEAHHAEADRLLSVDTAKLNFDPRKMDQMIDPLVLSYRMTGDPKYARKIHGIILRLVAQKNWVTDAPLLKRDPVWNSDLGMGFTAASFGLAYDTIRPTLSTTERKALINGFWDGLVAPVFDDWIDGKKRIHTLDSMGHNWWAHIVFGTGVGLIGIAQDEPRAIAYLQRLDAAASEWWSYGGSRIETKTATFDADGGYSESLNYADLAIATYLEYRLAWTEVFATPPTDNPLIGKATEFFLQNAYPSSIKSLSTNFGDGSLEASGTRALATLYLLGDRKPEYLWYINLFPKGDELRQSPRFVTRLPLKSEAKAQKPDLPISAWYRGMGWATLRSSWDDDATFLAVRSGFTWNHNHADAGSFVLFNQGMPLLIDSGNSSYGRKEYDQYYRQSLAHNVVTFDGEAEAQEDTYVGSQNMGYIPNLLDGAGVKYIFADATGPTSKSFARNYRHFLWLDGVILIIDDLKAYKPGQFEWLVHPEGDTKRQGLTLNVKNGAATVQIQPVWPMPFPDAGLPTDYPENMRLDERVGLKDHAPDVKVPYFALSPAEKSERALFMTALIPGGSSPTPLIERVESPDGKGVRITTKERVSEVYFNRKADGSLKHRNTISSLGGYETDASIVAFTYAKSQPSKLARLTLINGSYLRKDGRLLVDSLSKRFMIADYAGSTVQAWVQGQADARLGLYLSPGQSLGTVNGVRVRATPIDGLHWIRCCE